MRKGRTFHAKLLDSKDFPRVQPLTEGMRRRYGPGTILLPAPWQVQELMNQIPRGRVTTINLIRETLAQQHHATVACPIVTGIHARIVAGAAGEDLAAGRRRITPYWRTLREGGELNPKYPGGLQGQRRRLLAEGHRVVRRGTRLFLGDFDCSVVSPSPRVRKLAD